MPRSPSPDADNTDYALELQDFFAALLEDPEREAVASEIQGKASLTNRSKFYVMFAIC